MKIDKEGAKEKGRVARQLWDLKYRFFTENYMEKEYEEMIKDAK